MALREPGRDSGQLAHIALACCRAGKPDQAVQTITQGKADDWPVAWLVLALAHHELGKQDEARRWLDRADTWMDAKLEEALAERGVKLPLDWMSWAEFQVLRREARKALGAGESRADEKLEKLEDRARAALAP
jgi:hypothetical protein